MPADSTATIDPDFAKDVEAAIAAHREPLEPPAWDFDGRRPHLGGWLAVVIVDDMRWEEQIKPNAPVETAKEWAIKKALIDAHSSKYEEIYPLEAALSEP